MRILVVRLHPGQDLKQELQALVARERLESGFILTAVGSIQQLRLRLAGATEIKTFPGSFEIVSLVGTLSPQGLHLHMSASDKDGQTLGGHLMEGNPIHTTAEIVIGVPEGYRFRRVLDPSTGYPELVPEPTP